jgi:bifunctional UDP-N-acetylglucosamine pyrophosphorylase/glucosamine-1-phosphate N-acetyltransferase/UDP-N-acetylglucosamine pyrophosphorylase
LGTAHKSNPTGLGRIVRDAASNFDRIVEEKDATDEQRHITEVNMSTYLFNARDLLEALGKLEANNRQGEYYLTDCPGILKGMGRQVQALDVLKPIEALSINTMEELGEVETAMRKAGLAK